MNKKLRILFIVLLALVFAGSGAEVLRQVHEQTLADRAYEQAARLALAASAAEAEEPVAAVPEQPEQLPEEQIPMAAAPVEAPPEEVPEEARLLLELDLETLRATNADVLGWIHIPDTVISYPLMRSKDNNEYLHLTWDRVYSVSGSIFLEQKNSADLSDFNTIIYGHNMRDDSMFGQLHNYRDQEFAESQPCVYVATGDAILRYEVFSAYMAEVTGDTYRLYFEDEARRQSVIDFYLEQSEIETQIVPTVEDRILTLSTCTGLGNYSYRWVVQAVLTGQFPR